MKIRRSQVGPENRWLLILPALALALGCESKTDAAGEEAASNPPTPAETQAAVPVDSAVPAVDAVESVQTPPVASADVAAEGSPSAAASQGAKSDTAVTPAPGSAPGKGAAEPAPPAVATPRRGPAASGEGFNTWLEGKSSYALNQPATITLVLTADAPFKCNEQYPYKFTLAPSAGVTVSEPVVKGMNVGLHRSTLSIPFTPSATGSHTLSGELSFSVCTEDKCLIEKKALSIPFDVNGS